MNNQRISNAGPLNNADLNKINSANLSNLDRHYLRLLTHCLLSFQAMVKDDLKGPLPPREIRKEWFCSQAEFPNEDSFIESLMDQLDNAGKSLDLIALSFGISPLELKLENLIEFVSANPLQKS